jgi:hypothetical protein
MALHRVGLEGGDTQMRSTIIFLVKRRRQVNSALEQLLDRNTGRMATGGFLSFVHCDATVSIKADLDAVRTTLDVPPLTIERC